ncbi:MAG: phosphotransferase, partial [bacterium]
IPVRVTHNDTKINNVMIDAATDEAVCVIDLDTVMPGLVHYDFGDQIRTSTCTGTEDERELKKVAFRIGLFEGLARGYLEGAREFLTPCEIDCLAFSGPLITFEIGIRFLTDFLQGDLYFKTHRTGQNLDRCRTQFARARAMEAARSQMEAVIARYR